MYIQPMRNCPTGSGKVDLMAFRQADDMHIFTEAAMKQIEDRINGIVRTLLDDYDNNRVIDEVKSFDHPDKEVVVDILYSFIDPRIKATFGFGVKKKKTAKAAGGSR